jgi:hypothetical protein
MLKTDSQRPLLDSYKSKFGVSPAARLDSRWDRTEEGDKKQQPQNGDLTEKLTAELAPMAEAELSSEDGKCFIKVKVNLINQKQKIQTKQFLIFRCQKAIWH